MKELGSETGTLAGFFINEVGLHNMDGSMSEWRLDKQMGR